MAQSITQKYDNSDIENIGKLQGNWNKNVRTLLERLGWSKRRFVQELSARRYGKRFGEEGYIEIPERSVYRWLELGKEGRTKFPSYDNMRLVAKTLGVELADLLQDPDASEIPVTMLRSLSIMLNELSFGDSMSSWSKEDQEFMGIEFDRPIVEVDSRSVLDAVLSSRHFAKLLYRIALIRATEAKPVEHDSFSEAVIAHSKDTERESKLRNSAMEAVYELLDELLPSQHDLYEYISERAMREAKRRKRLEEERLRERYKEDARYGDGDEVEEEPWCYADNW